MACFPPVEVAGTLSREIAAEQRRIITYPSDREIAPRFACSQLNHSRVMKWIEAPAGEFMSHRNLTRGHAMNRTIRALGIATVLVTGFAGGSYAASMSTTAPNSTAPTYGSTTTYGTNQPIPRQGSTGNAVADSRGNTTTGGNIGSRTLQTGDGVVGPSAPSAGAKLGGGSK
jgi:hypothetical protein